METFSKACLGAEVTSATVNRVGRSALGLAAACLLALGGFASTLFAASRRRSAIVLSLTRTAIGSRPNGPSCRTSTSAPTKDGVRVKAWTTVPVDFKL